MFDRTIPSSRSVFALILSLALFATRASAQCGPDGLDGGPCCAPTGVILPTFPSRMMDVDYICYDGCVPQSVTYCANIGPPLPIAGQGGVVQCGAYNIRIRLRFCGTNNFVWLGFVNAYYSRNWQASSIPGTLDLNVWRFVINGDFLPTTFLPNNPRERPPCLSTYTRVYFSGHIDYALNCTTGVWQAAFSLSHECDGIHHMPGSARPAPAGGLHPTRSYSIVGPGSTFTPMSVSPLRSDGPIVQQAMRWNNWALVPSACIFEEHAQGTLAAQNEFCFCFTPGPTQYVATQVNANGSCGSAVFPSPAGLFLQKRLGTWTSPTVFPGDQFLLFDVGYMMNRNGCTGLTTQEWFEGVETIRGFPAFDFAGLALAPEFEDLGTCNRSKTLPTVRIGAPHVCNFILNFNCP